MEAAGPPLSAGRRAAVDRAREAWIRRLMDLSRRNNLLYYREVRGTLDLSAAPGEAMAALLSGEGPVPLSRLAPGAEEARTAAAVREVRSRALANLEEKGLQTLFLAVGLAGWDEAEPARRPAAPVVLVPMALESRGREGRSAALRRAGDPQVNLVLLHALETLHGVRADADALMESLLGDDPGEPFDPAPLFARLTAAAAGVKGFAVEARAILGNFSFQKMAMVRDLREQGEALAAHDLVAAVAGDPSAREAVTRLRQDPDPGDLDRTPPEEEFLVLDADSSQQRVVAAALAGQCGVVQGPPGTGKSQTIANLIASMAARGRRVLFVAEKRAALEAVLKRLESAGLGHLALDLHGADLSRAGIMKRLSERLALVRASAPADAAELHRRFSERREHLNGHVARLHAPRPPSGLGVYGIQGRLLRFRPEERCDVRWRPPELDRLGAAAVASASDLLAEAAGFGGLFLRDDPSGWTGAALPDGDAVRHATDLARRLARERFPPLAEALSLLGAGAGLPAPATLREARERLALLQEAAAVLSTYAEGIFAQDLDALERDLAPAGRGGLATLWARLFNGAYRSARTALTTLRRTGTCADRDLLRDAGAAAGIRRRWQALAGPGTLPRAWTGLEAARGRLEALRADLDALAPLLGRADLETLSLGDLGGLLGRLDRDAETPARLPRLGEIERGLGALGLEAFVAALRAAKPPASLWPRRLEYAWLASCLEQARLGEPALAGFNGRTHEGFAEAFRALDRERLKAAAARVRRAHAERVVAAMNAHPEQAALLRREAEKKARHLPLRRLLSEAPDVLLALCPCWMASPLSVSQLLPADRRHFALLLVDEASQILPEDAVPALLRAERAVVAGDRHQLPPTTFFAGGEDDEEEAREAAPEEGFESLLDLLWALLPRWPLSWHYRSRDESLIAFSNRAIYMPQGQELVTFPGPGGPPALSHVLVPQAAGEAGQEASATSEVARVADLVLRHAQERPDETLGVIAMGIPHARRVEAAIEEALRSRPELDAFFSPAREERFFVKNLERVQGDERDAIILTVGYGKDRSGRLPYRFGPLLMEGGERRLNVAVTRARRRMTVVSSFGPCDMDPSRSHAKGVALLRQYLEYAADPGRLPGSTGAEEPADPFAEEVREALEARGLELVARWGASRARLDFAVRDPVRPDRFAMAVECDGPGYAASSTARDRDRLRPQVLQALGWRHHRIWALDWYRNREAEIARLLAAYEDALSGTRPPAAPPPASAAEATAPPGRGPRPPLGRREGIEDYSPRELCGLVAWIQSDGRLRTDEEILGEAVEALGFKRRGPRIEEALRQALRQARAWGLKV